MSKRSQLKLFFSRIGAKHIIILIILALITIGLYNNLKYVGNINTMDETKLYQELVKINGIGDKIANKIIENRPYSSWDDFEKRINYVGEMRIKSLKNKFKLSISP